MMTKKNPFGADERNRDIFRRICTFLYIVTIYAMIGIILYRQIFLHQDSSQFNDLAMLMTMNVLLGIAAVLYFGAISFKKIRIRVALLFYILLVILGTAFSALLRKLTDFASIFDKFLINAAIGAILVSIWLLLAYLGKRRELKQLQDE
jgi:magnesium-transporting ATPase (P-type)